MNKTKLLMYTNRFSLSTISTLKSSVLLFAIALLFSSSTQAQDKKAKALLDAVTSKIKSYDNIVIDFKYMLVLLSKIYNKHISDHVVEFGQIWKKVL